TDVIITGNGIEFSPNPSDLYDLDHHYYYTWGINWQIPENHQITSATLSFYNINNWEWEENDILYVNLLDSALSGINMFLDDQELGNAFTGKGWLLFDYTDSDENLPANLVYSFNAAQLGLLNQVSADGNFGFGFDPDCHYFNDNIKFTVTTKVVPEPTAAYLFLWGGGIISFIIKRKKKLTTYE
ncbi:MAG: hypothetical protein N2606_04935, partial [Candidatus Omnitrophica bacterium]|nr:hypothetical protein [Candidatus Omnitrophota bacterium]